MLSTTCSTCSTCLPFDVTEVGSIAECPRCGTHQHLVPDQVLAVCEFLKYTHLRYCKQLREHFEQEQRMLGMTLQKRQWKATMSFEIGVYLFWWMEFLLQDCKQPPLTSILLNKLAQDTILLNTTPETAITRQQIAQLRDIIGHRAYGSDPPPQSRQLVDHLAKAMEYRFQKYTTCLHNGESNGHIIVGCLARLRDFIALNNSSDDLSTITVADGPLVLRSDESVESFQMFLHFLVAMEETIVMPYQCVLQNLFESKGDLLALDLSEIEAITIETMTDVKSKLECMHESRASV